jgi:hypothetical protein
MPVGLQITVTGDQAVIKTLGTLSKNMRLALGRAILVEAHDLRALIVKGIRDQAPGGMKFKPLSEMTKKLRMMQRKGSAKKLGSATKSMRTEMNKRMKALKSRKVNLIAGTALGVRSNVRISAAEKKLVKSDARIERAENKLDAATSGMKALINSGSLIGSINVTKIGKDPLDGVFVGVHRSARRKKGQGGDPVSIAAVHEFGSKAYTVTVTKKMRGWWFAMYKAGVFSAPLKKTTTSITRKTPARPYIRPSVSVWKEKLEERLGRRIQMEIDKIIAASGAKGT